ncbi:MAG: AraC family transcriptional regulator [Spirochaetales bacterium]|nr:AraC family transcriptional regulator [Spirochaetales bacterium]
MQELNLYVSPPIPDKRFPFYLEKQRYHNKKEIFRPHWHEHFELIFMLDGELLLNCNAQSFVGKLGDLFIINPNDLHHLQSLSPIVEYYCIVFDLNIIKSSLIDIFDNDFIQPLIDNSLFFKQNFIYNSYLLDLVNKLSIENESNDVGRTLAIKSYLMLILSNLFRNADYTILKNNNFVKRKSNLRMIQGILVYLNKNFNLDIDLKQLAVKFNISYHHLCHVFKEYTNQSIIKYVTLLRIEKSIFYLENTTYTITEVASLVGYEDSNYFSRMFKKIMTISPSEYINSLSNKLQLN